MSHRFETTVRHCSTLAEVKNYAEAELVKFFGEVPVYELHITPGLDISTADNPETFYDAFVSVDFKESS